MKSAIIKTAFHVAELRPTSLKLVVIRVTVIANKIPKGAIQLFLFSILFMCSERHSFILSSVAIITS